MQWVELSVGVLFNALANILMKYGVKHLRLGQTSAGVLARVATDPALLLGVASFALALAGYGAALRRVPLSTAYPIMTGLGLIIVSAVSTVLFREGFTALKSVGVVLILVGVVLVTRPA